MPRKGKGSNPTKGRKNSKKNSHIGSPPMSRKPNPIQTHHTGTVHLDSSVNSSGVVQSVGSKRETMADHEDHVEGTGENQVGNNPILCFQWWTLILWCK